MEKNIYRFIQITTLLFILTSCSSTKKTEVKKFQACNSKSSCNQIYNCYRNNLSIHGIDKIDSICDITLLLKCTIELAKAGNKEAHLDLYNYFLNYYNTSEDKGNIPSYIACYSYAPVVSIFSQMRGKDIFNLALLYAAKTECINLGDVEGGGNLSLNFVEYIINPMIKSVGGEETMGMYLYVDNYKNRTVKPTSSDPCQRAHEFTYGELIKAYKEGKIVLKKYGE